MPSATVAQIRSRLIANEEERKIPLTNVTPARARVKIKIQKSRCAMRRRPRPRLPRKREISQIPHQPTHACVRACVRARALSASCASATYTPRSRSTWRWSNHNSTNNKEREKEQEQQLQPLRGERRRACLCLCLCLCARYDVRVGVELDRKVRQWRGAEVLEHELEADSRWARAIACRATTDLQARALCSGQEHLGRVLLMVLDGMERE